MKTTRVIFLVASTLLFVVAMFLSPCPGHCESTNATYPPYPSKLIFDVDTSRMFKDRNLCADFISMTNGDYLFLYSNSTGRLLFKNKEILFSDSEYLFYCSGKRNLLGLMADFYNFEDGDSVSIGAHPKCYEALGTHINIYIKDISTKKTTKKSYALINLLPKSRVVQHINRNCEMDEVSGDSVIEKFYSSPMSLIVLKDNSFLLLVSNCENSNRMCSGGFNIYRFNKDTIHSMKLGEKRFLVDIDQITRLAIGHKGGNRITYQNLIDETIEYIRNIN